jgi:FlaA1/EpsC-like NDP-sugar epimerase
MMENNVGEAIQNNVRGTKIIADLAVKHGTGKFVMISTDKAVNPSNVMGCSKRICEIYVQSLNRHVHTGGAVRSLSPPVLETCWAPAAR